MGCRFVGLQTVRLPIYDSGDGFYGRQTVYSEMNRTNVTAWDTVCQISRISQFVERKTGKPCLENDRSMAMAASVAQKSAHTGSPPWSRECDVQGHTGRGWSRGWIRIDRRLRNCEKGPLALLTENPCPDYEPHRRAVQPLGLRVRELCVCSS